MASNVLSGPGSRNLARCGRVEKQGRVAQALQIS